jgi:xylulokinase
MPRAELVLALDLGTTCFKGALIDRDGRIRGLGRVLVEKDCGGGRCELPVERFWRTLRRAVEHSLRQAGANVRDIRAISYSSQANSFLLLDEGKEPVTPLILWPDLRAAEPPGDLWLDDLWAGSEFLEITGLGLGGPEFCARKLKWFQQQRPDLWARCVYVQSLSDYLVFSLTGLRVGDQATAALLGLLDVVRGTWWSDALRAVGVRREQLSQPLLPGTEAGPTVEAATTLLNLPAGIPLVLGTLDHHAAAMGAGIRSVDVPSVSIGTVLACVRYQPIFSSKPGCALGPGPRGWYPFLMIAFENRGTAILDRHLQSRRFRGPIERALALADAAPIGSNGVMAVPIEGGDIAFVGGRSPSPTEGELVRSLIECSSVGLLALIERLYPGVAPRRVVAAGGGTRSDFWPRLLADLCGVEVAISPHGETAAIGAGMLAAVVADWFGAIDDVSTAWTARGRVIEPDPSRHAAYRRWVDRYRAFTHEMSSPGVPDRN